MTSARRGKFADLAVGPDKVGHENLRDSGIIARVEVVLV
jgi:hypothetical protein